MKEFDKDELKKIAYNCRKATFLIEKKQLGRITLREKIELKIHLAGCPVCRLYEKQSIAISRMIKDLLHTTAGKEKALEDNFKQKLKERIEQTLQND